MPFMSSTEGPQISQKSKTIAINTAAMYFRMFILMLVGLYTSRIVLNALGIEDRGIYEAVGSIVSMMAIISGTLASAIGRFMSVGVAEGDMDKLRRIFGTSLSIMLIIAGIVIIIAEPLGLWYIRNVMNLPEGRMEAAVWVFQFSLASFAVSLISVPFYAIITAHEKMTADAVIGIVEGCVKFIIALLITRSPIDTLVFYSMLMFGSSLLSRFMYTTYCRRRFEESRAGLCLDRAYMKQMFSFAGWNGMAIGINIVNTQGITLLINYFFGVALNTVRGIALNVENMIRQLVNNVMKAMNPQITKSYAAGDKGFSFTLVCKAAKYSFLIIFVVGLPFMFETDILLRLWLGEIVPEETAVYTRLGIVFLCVDMMTAPLNVLIQAYGKIRKYYLNVCSFTVLAFPLTWLMYRLGLPGWSYYLAMTACYLIAGISKFIIVKEKTGFKGSMYLREVVWKILPVAVIGTVCALVPWLLIPQGIWRLMAVLLTGTLGTAAGTYFFALTPGERAFIDSKIPFLRNKPD